MAIDPEVQAAIDVVIATVTANNQAAQAAVVAARARLTALEDRGDVFEEAGIRLRRALREGHFDGESGTFVDALASALGLSARDLKDALMWAAQERRKVRS